VTGQIIRAEPTVLDAHAFAWMVGRVVRRIEFSEPGHWVIALSDRGTLATDALWRVLDGTRLVTTSEDHGQLFGLKEPVNAAHRAVNVLSSLKILDVELEPAHSDLTIRFENQMVLQFLSTSCGYESWQVEDPNGVCVVVDGAGNASTWRTSVPPPA
jgi:hypothetical protein